MLTGIYGNPEQGMTLSLSLWGSSGKGIISTWLADKVREMPIFTNFKLYGFDNWEYLTPDKLYEIGECGYDYVLIEVDEAVTWLESRAPKDETALYVDYMLAQSRKNNEDWVMESQLKSMLDKRFRLMTNMEIYCADRRLRGTNGEPCKDDFHYVFTNGFKFIRKTMRYKDAQKYFPMYDTKEKIFSPKFEKLQFSMNEQNKEKLNKMIDEYTEKVLTIVQYEYKNITQYMVKDAFVRLSLPLDYVPYVFARIKSKVHIK